MHDDPADTEPAWASPPRPETAKRQKKRASDRRCCCEATMDDMTTHGWEPVSRCKSDADEELSAGCVNKAACKGIPDD